MLFLSRPLWKGTITVTINPSYLTHLQRQLKFGVAREAVQLVRKVFWKQVAQLTLLLHSFTLDNFFATFQEHQETQAQMITKITSFKLTFIIFIDKEITMSLLHL